MQADSLPSEPPGKPRTTIRTSKPSAGRIPWEKHNADRHVCTPRLMAALFTTVRTWEQPACPTSDEWIKTIWHIYNESIFHNIESESRSVISDSLQHHGLYSPWNSPGQNTGVSSLSLLQGIFPAQGSNPCLPHCRWMLYHMSHEGSPSHQEALKSN